MNLRQSTLPNGIRVVTEKMDRVMTTAMAVEVGRGCRDETAHENGISHFLEHMAFKGTATRTARQIAEEIEAVGGDLNAATSYESTAYTARMLAEYVPLAVEMLADILTTPQFARDEIERERGVILQEIGAYEDSPDSLVYDYFSSLAYPNQPLGRTILGTAQTLKTFSRETLESFRARFYHGPEIIITAAGAVEHEAFTEHVSRAFASMGAHSAPHREPAQYKGGEQRVTRKLEQTHILLGYPGFAQTDERSLTLDVFSTIVGGGMSSRLFQDIREEKGLAYSVYAHTTVYEDAGLLQIYAGTDPKAAKDVEERMRDIVYRAASSLTEEEIRRAKAQIKAGLVMALESSASRADQLARHMQIYGRVLSMQEMLERLDAIDKEALHTVATIALEGAPTTITLGPKV
jgi:predicted Zn-dependent peptidase